jgi:hypothetical protein
MITDPRDLARDDDDRPPRRPMCRCVVRIEWVTDLIAVTTHPDLIELDEQMRREL